MLKFFLSYLLDYVEHVKEGVGFLSSQVRHVSRVHTRAVPGRSPPAVCIEAVKRKGREKAAGVGSAWGLSVLGEWPTARDGVR